MGANNVENKRRKYTKESRIRYRKISEGIYHSVRVFQSKKTGAKYMVKLNEITWEWRVINVGQRKIVKKGKRKNKYWIRQKAKKALMELGVEFDMKVLYYVDR